MSVMMLVGMACECQCADWQEKRKGGLADIPHLCEEER